MATRCFRRAGIGLVLVIAGTIGGITIDAQSPSRSPERLPGADLARLIVTKYMTRDFVPPKTPWGHPDLQGNFTARDEANTPLERPDEFKGRSIDSFTPEEMAKIVAQRQAQAFENTLFAFGGRAEGIAIGVPVHWMDHLDSKNSRPWLIVEPADGKIPPASASANARGASVVRAREGRGPADSYSDRSLVDRCIVRTIPAAAMLPTSYGNSLQILQTKDHVVIRHEMVHEARIIPLDGRPHLEPAVSSYFGDGRGHFEGNTLVVVTTNVNDRVNYRNASTKLRTIERFTRTAPNKIEWTVTIDDPDTWAQPWTYSMPYTENDNEMIIEYACHEGNYSLRNILTAQRADEAKGVQIKTGEDAESERREEGR